MLHSRGSAASKPSKCLKVKLAPSNSWSESDDSESEKAVMRMVYGPFSSLLSEALATRLRHRRRSATKVLICDVQAFDV